MFPMQADDNSSMSVNFYFYVQGKKIQYMSLLFITYSIIIATNLLSSYPLVYRFHILVLRALYLHKN